jgi:hypothetical protein
MLTFKSAKSVFSIKSSRSVASSFKSARSQINASASVAPSVASSASTFTRRAVPAMSRFARKISDGSNLSFKNLETMPNGKADKKMQVLNWLDRSYQPESAAISKSLRSAKTNLPEHKAAQERLVKKTKTIGAWGGNIELVALARSLGVAIHIIPRDNNAKKRFDWHFGKVSNVINESGGIKMYLSYNGTHYDALVAPDVQADGTVRAAFSPVPGDGDCMYHAVAAASTHGFSAVPGLHSMGQLKLRLEHPIWQGVFAGEPNISDDEAFGVMREAYMLQLRYDAAKELTKPKYAEGAFHQEIID